MTPEEKIYQEHISSEKKYTDKILSSNAKKKVIIAGPGTGKSYLFREICRDNYKNGKTKNLTLSFINELVDDLKVNLYELSEVRTLHSFALSKFKNGTGLFFGLESIIEEDYKIINNKKINFKKIFSNLIKSDESLRFYLKRRKYYNSLGPNDSIYTLIKYFEENKTKIPQYDQILVDEFQDFNKLEAHLIDLLSEKSPLLIVGDDDQSLYSFKYANSDEIRSRYKSKDYLSLELPFCHRCTEVIINSFDNIIKNAKENGFLKKRKDKKYWYFSSKDKNKLSIENPKILIKKQVHCIAVAYNIEREIKEFFDPRQKDASVLVVCSLKSQIKELKKRLHDKGFRNIQSPLTPSKIEKDKLNRIELINGFNLLLVDKECNLGWRIISKHILNKNGKDYNFYDIVKKSYLQKEDVKFKDLLDAGDVKEIKFILAIFKKIKGNENLKMEECEKIFNILHYNPIEIAIQKLKSDLDENNTYKKTYRDIPIKITTILGSKGLTRDYVFLVNFDDKYILDKSGKKITDESICKFLVALTRAKRRVYIYFNENRLPTFVSWLGKNVYDYN